jgi:hypothetical protein
MSSTSGLLATDRYLFGAVSNPGGQNSLFLLEKFVNNMKFPQKLKFWENLS